MTRVQFESSADACIVCLGYDGHVWNIAEADGIIPVHVNCLTYFGTPVYTADGWKGIGKIGIGELVLTHKGRFRRVVQVHRTPRQRPEVVTLSLGVRSMKRKKLQLTADHPVLVNGQWRRAREVEAGDKVKFLVEEKEIRFDLLPISSVSVSKPSRPITLYNLSVEEDESYVAKGFVVHNCRCTWRPVREEIVKPGE